MEEKKSGKKVGVNTSSGAKKVQRIEKEKQASAVPASGTVKRTVTKKVEEENAAAGVRLEAAKARAERKARREQIAERLRTPPRNAETAPHYKGARGKKYTKP